MRTYLYTFFFFVVGILPGCNSPSKSLTSRPPNIIILFCDDLGYGDLGIYGHPTIRTPNLDNMANKGMRFSQFYSGSPACTASRYALLTGRYPVSSGFDWVLYPKSKKGIHNKERTIAEGLKEAGYATGCFGKWHLGSTKKDYLPLQNGFDEYIGLPYSNDMLPPKWPDIALLDGNDTLEINPDQSKLTALYTDKAKDFIKRHKDQPFFVYLPYAMPHVPLHPGPAFAGQSLRGLYGDVVEEIDWSVGSIIETINDLGLAENSLIFFTSDNGPWIIKEELGGSAGLLRDGKGSTWEGGMRVPGIALWKGLISEGQKNTFPSSTLDLFPTCMQLAKGEGIAGTFLDPESAKTAYPFYYYGPRKLHAVRVGPWKLHVHTSSQTGKDYFEGKLPLLFNLENDPSELYDVSDVFPKIVDSLLNFIKIQNHKIEKEGTYWD